MAKYVEILRRQAKALKKDRALIRAGKDPRRIVPTGLREFDKRGGHKRKILTVYGAATGEGKSTWKNHMARAAAKLNYRVAILDMEDPEELTANRDFANATGINSAKMTTADLTDKEVNQIDLALTEMVGWAENIEVETGVKSAEDALEWLNSFDEPFDLVIIDYLSALPHGKGGRERAISDFCWELTKYAQENNAAMVALAQTTGEVSMRGMRMYEQYKRHQQFRNDGEDSLPYIEGFRGFDNNDLAWCKDAGRNAKELGFLFRPAKYYKLLLGGKCKVEDNRMEFTFPKRNFGSDGTIVVGLDLKTSTLYDLPDKKAA